MTQESETTDDGHDFDFTKFPPKAYHMRLGQTLCEACQFGVDLGDMVFHQTATDYGYYHPECVPK